MKISDKYKCIFVHIPKTGGTMLYNSFGVDMVANGHHHQAAFQTMTEEPELWQEYKSFTVIRNPWELELSHFLFLVSNPRNPNHLDACRSGMRIIIGKSFWRWHRTDQMHESLIDHPLRDSINRFITDDNTGELLVDYVIRNENLAEDWKRVAPLLGIEDTDIINYPQWGRDNVTRHRHYREYYKLPNGDWDEGLIELVRTRHSDYIEQWGYEF